MHDRLEEVLASLDASRAAVDTIMNSLASHSPHRKALVDPVLAISQAQARLAGLQSSISAANGHLRVLRDRVEAAREPLIHARQAYENDVIGIEPPAKRARTVDTDSKRLSKRAPDRVPVPYKTVLCPPTLAMRDTFLNEAKTHFANLEIDLSGPALLSVRVKNVLRANLILLEVDGLLEVDRVLVMGFSEDIPIHGASSNSLFQLVSAAHDRPAPLEETLARLDALISLYTAPCSKLGCHKKELSTPLSELPVERILRADGEVGDPTFDAFHRQCWAALRP